MGWRGTMRSIGAAMRAAERDADRNRKIRLKTQAASDTADAVAALDEYLDNLVSIHTDLRNGVDWHTLANQPKPIAPVVLTTNEDRAYEALQSFKPSLFDTLKGGSERRRARLADAIDEARTLDHAEFERANVRHSEALEEWEADTGLARRLVAGEGAAIREVISEMQSWTSEDRLGSFISFEIDNDLVHAKVVVHGESIVPRVRRKQLASGALSESQMPIGTFNELYQDYVSSVALRLAGDLFNLCPLPEVYVTCLADMLDPSTGHMAQTPILSVHFVRKTFSALNLDALDPSDAMRNFRHTMSFKRTTGFAAVEPVAAFRTE